MEYWKNRPVPSKAALRVLYQLAYISSGTLVGAAALCAEERRRRTQIVQTIADNAKRIRASPRYNHHTAAAATTFTADSESFEFLGTRRRRPTSLSSLDSQSQNVESAPYLPSAVQDGYAFLVERRSRSEKRLKEPSTTKSQESVDIYSKTAENDRNDVSKTDTLRSCKKTRSPPASRIKEQQRPRAESLRGDITSTQSFVKLLPQLKNQMSFISVWKRTRNYDFVMREIQKLEEICRASEQKKDALQLLSMAKLEIMIEAGREELVLKMLNSTDSNNLEREYAKLARALIYAKRRHWEKVSQALNSIDQMDSLDVGIVKDWFRRIVRLYAENRDCGETWKFIETLEQRHSFRPDKETSMTFMLAMVAQDRYDLLPEWLKHIRRLGDPLKFHGLHAARLMTRYYDKHRPRVAQLESLCRILQSASATLAGHQYKDLIKLALSREMTDKGRWLDHSHLATTELHMTALNFEFEDVSLESQQSHNIADNNAKGSRAALDKHEQSLSSLHAAMFLALSQHKFDRVLEMYEQSLTAERSPISILALELAVKASLRLHPTEPSRARRLLNQAHGAGVNIACGQDAMTIHELRLSAKTDKFRGETVLKKIQAYSNLISTCDYPANPHVWLAAASLLIKRGYPESGLDILQNFYKQYPSQLEELTPAALTTFLKGFTGTRYLRGVRWICNTSSSQDIRVSTSFLRTFRQSIRDYQDESSAAWILDDGEAKLSKSEVLETLQDWFADCQLLKQQQDLHAFACGQRLVRCLIECAKQQDQPALPSEDRAALDQALFGRQERVGQEKILAPEAKTLDLEEADDERLEPIKTLLVQEIGLTKVMGRQKRAHNDLLWRLRYRRFYDRDVLLADGAIASFRFFCPEIGSADQRTPTYESDDSGRVQTQSSHVDVSISFRADGNSA